MAKQLVNTIVFDTVLLT